MSINRLPQFITQRIANLEATNRSNCQTISRLQRELASEQVVSRSLTAENRRLRALLAEYDHVAA